MTHTKMQKLTNHIAFVIDESASMRCLSSKVVKVFDSQIKHLRARAEELDQETRVSVYLFSYAHDTRCIVFDMDVMRVKSLNGFYSSHGNTALMDATKQSLDDLKQIPELHSDHAFLVYVLTDGEENDSKKVSASQLKTLIDGLPEHWTVVAQVPNSRGLHEIKQFGFSQGNVEIWDATSAQGVEKAGRAVSQSIDSYMTLRSTGVRGTKAFFTTSLKAVTEKDVKQNLDYIGPNKYDLLQVRKDSVIKPFVEAWQGAYVPGSAYYELMKPETVQAHKRVAIQHKANGKVYTGDAARQVLQLPSHEIRVSPGDHDSWRVFVQSTSVNRKLLPGTQVLVLK